MPTNDTGPISHLAILGHPGPPGFNHAVADAYCSSVRECGQEAVQRDLYALGFDPLRRDDVTADIAEDLELLRNCDVLTLIYPIWFGMPPAIVKGYIDRVLGAAFQPDRTMDAERAALSGRHFVSFSSSASTRPWLEEQGQWISLRQGFDAYLAMLFDLQLGKHVHFDSVVSGMDARLVAENLAVVQEETRVLCSELASKQRRKDMQSLLHRRD